MEVKNLSSENVWDLSEEQAFHVFQEIQNESEKERRSQYLKIIDTAFELRSLSRSRRDLKEGLSKHGFKFFKVDEKSSILIGVCKRRAPGHSAL